MKIQFIDPATDFSDGLAVIRAYHDSLLRHGRALLNLVTEIGDQSIDAKHAERLAWLYAYYQRATQLHHLDEERVLFPAIAGHGLLIDGMLERLALDHEEIEEAWRVLEIALNQFLDHHLAPDNLEEKIARFEKLQREHLLRENEDFLPQVERNLSPKQRKIMGLSMAAMRGKAR